MKLEFRIIPNNGIELCGEKDDYIGLSIYLDGEYKTTFTGFLDADIMRDFLSGKGVEIK